MTDHRLDQSHQHLLIEGGKTGLQEHMRLQDIKVFQDCAQTLKVYILVRRTNPDSLQYVGRKGYLPKRIDCKAKTADRDVFMMQGGGKFAKTAGLVVDPTVTGMKVYGEHKSPERILSCWRQFVALQQPERPAEVGIAAGVVLRRGAQGGCYGVETDPEHEHYGCVFFSPFDMRAGFDRSLLQGMEKFYIHGDYDLYGIVSESDPAARNMHTDYDLLRIIRDHRNSHLYAVAKFINSRIGAPMVQHGSQENLEHIDKEIIDVFWADRRITSVNGIEEIRRLYAQGFKGRGTGDPAGTIRRA